MEMVVEGRREKAAAEKVSRRVCMGGQERPKSSCRVKASLKPLKRPAEHPKLVLQDSIKVTGKRLQVNCAKGTSSLLAHSYSTEDKGSWQSIPHEVISEKVFSHELLRR